MYLTQCITCATGDVEYWNENDSDIDEDFSIDVQSDEPATPNPGEASQDGDLSTDVIWWVVVFTCLFETLHSLSSRAITWLLHFLSSLFFFLSRYSNSTANIARAFPSTLHQCTNYPRVSICISCVLHYNVFSYDLSFMASVKHGDKGLKHCSHVC